MKINIEGKREIIGSMVYYITNVINVEGIVGRKEPFFQGTPVFEFRPIGKYLNKEENFICSVNQGDIINIRSDYTETITEEHFNLNPDLDINEPIGYDVAFASRLKGVFTISYKDPYLHTATLTFLFKEISFRNILELDPLDG